MNDLAESSCIQNFVSMEDVLFFQEHGWWASSKALPDEIIDGLLFDAERYLHGERDTAFSDHLNTILSSPSASYIVQGDYLSLQMDFARSFIRHPVLPRIASVFCGESTIRLFHDQLIVKLPGGTEMVSAVGWHSDKSYWKSCTSTRMLTAWVALHDMNIAMGPLSVWDKSHVWDYEDNYQTFAETNLYGLEEQFTRKGSIPQIVNICLEKGQFSFHHCRLIHGSYPNRSNKARFAYAIHYQDSTNLFNPTNSVSGRTGHINDLLCNKSPSGYPDYADPDICPQLWPIT